MAHAVDEAGRPSFNIPGSDSRPVSRLWGRRTHTRDKASSSGTDSSLLSPATARNGVAGWLGSAARSLRIKLAHPWWKMRRTRSTSSGDSDIEGRPSEDVRSGSGVTRSGGLPSRASESSVLASGGAGSRVSGSRGSETAVREAQECETLQGGTGARQNDTVEAPPINEDVDIPPKTEPLRRSTDRQSGAHRSVRSTETSNVRLADSDVVSTDKNLHEHLIQGYLATRPSREPSLQLRQTLDQYLYSHLESTSQRDEDQVVYRFTKGEPIPKMFMVDQLWMWILGNGK